MINTPVKLEDLDRKTRWAVKGLENRTGDGETPEVGQMLAKIRDKCMADEYVDDDARLIRCMFYNIENVMSETRQAISDLYRYPSFTDENNKDRWWSGGVDKKFQKELKQAYVEIEEKHYGKRN